MRPELSPALHLGSVIKHKVNDIMHLKTLIDLHSRGRVLTQIAKEWNRPNTYKHA